MKARRFIIVSALLFTAACGSSTAKPAATTTTEKKVSTPTDNTQTAGSSTTTIVSTTSTAAPSGGATIALATTSLGQTVTTAKGLTVYILVPDGADTTKSTCSGGCATLWPPVPATATPDAGTTGLKLTSIIRDDGSKQLAVNGRPVYRYAGDTKAGDVNGHGVGNIWYAIGADGKNLVTK